MVTPDRLDPLPPVVADGVTFLVDRARPVAVLRDGGGSVRVVTWPDAPLPARSASASVLAAPGCVWVIYTEHSIDDPGSDGCTAVRVGLDGQVAACEAEASTPIGADEVGLWVSPDPYLAMGDGLSGEGSELDGDGGASSEPPPWLERAPVQPWDDVQRAERQAGEVEAAAGLLAAAPPEDGEEDLGWFAYPPGEGAEPPVALPEPPAPQPSGPATVRRVRTDGQVEEMVVSRVVSRIEATGDGAALRVVFHPTGPVLTPDGYGGYGVHYPQRTAEVDLSAGLPAGVDLEALASRPVDEDEDEDEDSVVDEGDRVDLADVAGTRWTPRPLDAGEVEAAVRAVREQYAALDEPRSVWTARDDRRHRVQAPYADLAVRVEGAWPDTEVVVDFAYLPERGRLFRRRTRVFDHVGVPSVSPYLEVYLDEDLATTDLEQLPVRDGRSQI